MNLSFSSEPSLYIAAFAALVDLAIGFGLPVTPDQRTLIIGAVTVIAGILIRSQVTPVSKLPVVPVPPSPPAG